jgi:hypothetical protein
MSFSVDRLLAGQRIELGDRLDLVAEQARSARPCPRSGRETGRPCRRARGRCRAGRHCRCACTAARRSGGAGRNGRSSPLVQAERHLLVVLQRTDAVDARDRGDDDDVVALHQRARRGVAHPVDLLVDRRILLDEGVGARYVGFGLVVIVVRDEVLDRILREETLHLGIELRRQRLVGRHHQRRPPLARNHVGHGEGLARAGDAQQDLVALARFDTGDQLPDCFGLVARGRVVRHQLERPRRYAFELRPPLDVRHQEGSSRNREIL